MGSEDSEYTIPTSRESEESSEENFQDLMETYQKELKSGRKSA